MAIWHIGTVLLYSSWGVYINLKPAYIKTILIYFMLILNQPFSSSSSSSELLSSSEELSSFFATTFFTAAGLAGAISKTILIWVIMKKQTLLKLFKMLFK